MAGLLRWLMSPWGVALAAAAFARWLYSGRALNPASVDWLLHGDPAQHFLGSAFFLSERWHWPPGLIRGFGDNPTSVVFTDAIPLLALPAKLLGLAPSLQYYGVWMLACHVLAGLIGMRLLQRLGVARGPAALGALFFVIAPAMLMRAYGHEALMAHFLILAALERALAPWRWAPWLLVVAVAVLVHPYLALMVASIGCAAAVAALCQRQVTWRQLLLQAAASFPVVAGLAWMAGYFVGSGQASATGHGYFSANLLTWFDSMDWGAFWQLAVKPESDDVREWSRWLRPLGQATAGQYEGFAYLGAGMILMLFLVLNDGMRRRSAPTGAMPGGTDGIGRAQWLALTIACLAFALLALSARPTLGKTVLFEVPLGETTRYLLGVFRSSGRFIWPLTYLLMAVVLARVGKWPHATKLLALCLVVQATDLSGKFDELRSRFRFGPMGIESRVTDPRWPEILARCPRVEWVSALADDPGWIGPALAAASAGASFAPAPTARLAPEAVAARQAGMARMLAANAWQPQTVYVLAKSLPQGFSMRQLAGQLPADKVHLRLDGRDLVMSAVCAAR